MVSLAESYLPMWFPWWKVITVLAVSLIKPTDQVVSIINDGLLDNMVSLTECNWKVWFPWWKVITVPAVSLIKPTDQLVSIVNDG